MPLTKADLIEGVSQAIDIPRRDAAAIVKVFLATMAESLKAGEPVELRGFGSFRFRDRGARIGRNPRTGAVVHVPPKRVVYFKMGKELKRLVNGDAPGSPSS